MREGEAEAGTGRGRDKQKHSHKNRHSVNTHTQVHTRKNSLHEWSHEYPLSQTHTRTLPLSATLNSALAQSLAISFVHLSLLSSFDVAVMGFRCVRRLHKELCLATEHFKCSLMCSEGTGWGCSKSQPGEETKVEREVQMGGRRGQGERRRGYGRV